MNIDQKNTQYILLSIVVVIIAGGLRFYNLNGTCLWLDEAVNANNAFGTFSEMLSNTRKNNSAPILLPVLLWSIQDFISQPWIARFFPAIFGLGAVVVCLILPFAGIPKQVSALSGIALCFSPIQIQYSQEVREYSAGVFLSALMIFFFLLHKKENQKLFAIFGFILCVGLSPLVSYGVIFMAFVLVGMFCLDCLTKKNNLLWAGIVCVVFVLSMRYSYLLTAIYQQGVAQSWHLAAFYPSGGLLKQFCWLFSSIVNYIDFNVGVTGSAFLLFCIASIIISKGYTHDRILKERGLFLAFLGLLFLLVCLAFVKKYPFGGARQVLFAAPLVVLVFANFVQKIMHEINPKGKLYFWFITAWIVLTSIGNLPNVYADQQDVIGPVELKPAELSDQDVFIDAWGVPSIQYHYPNREFIKSKFQPAQLGNIVEQINSMPGNKRLVIFSERSVDEVRQMEVMLSRTNSKVELIKRYKEGFPTQTFVFLVTR